MPLTIDGEPVREVTIDGSLVTGLTIDGDIVFETVESFEDGNITEYALDTGSFSVQQATVYNGNDALEASFAGSGTNRIVSTNFSVSSGNTYRYNIRPGALDVTAGALFGIQDETSVDGYFPRINPNSGDFELFVVTNGAFSLVAEDANVSYSADQWFEVEFDWGSSGSLAATLFDNTGSQLASISGSDSSFTSGGIGFRLFI